MLLYSVTQDTLMADTFVEKGVVETYADSPDNYSGLRQWYKADSLIGSYSQSQNVLTWSNSAPGYTGDKALSLYTPPTFNMESILGGIPGRGVPSIHFSGSAMNLTGYDLGDPWTVQILVKNAVGTLLSDGLSPQWKLNRLNNYAQMINNGEGYTLNSNPFSTNITGSVLLTFLNSGLAGIMYEGDTSRQGGGLFSGQNLGFSYIDMTKAFDNAEIVEICSWRNNLLSQPQITSLYNSYWRQKYFYEPMFEATPVTQSIPPLSLTKKISISASNITVLNQLVENSTISNRMIVSSGGRLTVRSFTEGSLINLYL